MASDDRKVTVANLDNAIREILSNYGEEINGHVGNGLKQVANNARKKLRAASPEGRTKKYRGGWGYKLSRTALGSWGLVIYNQGIHASLTHLLEKGHAKRNGDFLPGKEHIAPVNEEAQKEFIGYLDKAISGKG